MTVEIGQPTDILKVESLSYYLVKRIRWYGGVIDEEHLDIVFTMDVEDDPNHCVCQFDWWAGYFPLSDFEFIRKLDLEELRSAK